MTTNKKEGKFKIAMQMRAKHGVIYQYINDNNLTIATAAKKIGISICTLIKILHFRWTPSDNYQTKKTEKKLCDFFQCEVEDLFPAELVNQIQNNSEITELLQNKRVAYPKVNLEFLDYNQVDTRMLSYDANLDKDVFDKQRKGVVADVLDATLTPKEKRVIELRFSDEEPTLEEIGKKIGKHKERVRQIEAKALRKLKRGEAIERLKEISQ